MEILDYYFDMLYFLGGLKFDRYNDLEVMIEYKRLFMMNVIWLICLDGLQSKERVEMFCERMVVMYEDYQVIEMIFGQLKFF